MPQSNGWGYISGREVRVSKMDAERHNRLTVKSYHVFDLDEERMK
jgi:hypothetical protein